MDNCDLCLHTWWAAVTRSSRRRRRPSKRDDACACAPSRPKWPGVRGEGLGEARQPGHRASDGGAADAGLIARAWQGKGCARNPANPAPRSATPRSSGGNQATRARAEAGRRYRHMFRGVVPLGVFGIAAERPPLFWSMRTRVAPVRPLDHLDQRHDLRHRGRAGGLAGRQRTPLRPVAGGSTIHLEPRRPSG